MLYERSFLIEKRLQDVLELVRSGRYSTPAIAEKLGVSVPTVSRDVTALRERGHDIRSERHGDSWRYVLGSSDAEQRTHETRTRSRRAVTA
jgi:biotin operon repressor